MATDRDEELRNRAYRIWESEGRPEGMEAEHWARAERELAAEAANGSAAAVAPAETPASAGPMPAAPARRSRTKPAATPDEPAVGVVADVPVLKKRAAPAAAKPKATRKKKD
jgi:hypothetical protein